MLTKHGGEIFDGQYHTMRDIVTPVDVTPCSKWVQSSEKEWSIVEDLSILLPPWDFTWMEYFAPHSMERVGCLMSYTEWDRFINELTQDSPFTEKLDSNLSPHDPNYIVWYRLFIWVQSTCLEVCRLWQGLDEMGEAVSSNTVCNTTPQFERRFQNMSQGASRAEMIPPLMTPIHLGVSLCHANNVDLYEDEVPTPVQEKRRKSGKNPGKTFKCLDIESMKKQSRRESKDGESDVERALHICRGHFKTYTEDNPLFGKHTGTYWWPMHVRGNEDAGEVNKSYRVNEPE
jgi:hypothetical protein